MKIALIADVHGNEIALRHCLRVIRDHGIGPVHFLGDAVGYYPAAEEVVHILRTHVDSWVMGNHEAMLLDPTQAAAAGEHVYRLSRVRKCLDADSINWIGRWPHTREFELEGRRILLVHATPQTPLNGRFSFADLESGLYADLPHEAVFMAHTHRPFRIVKSKKLFVNVGSIGQPRDHGTLASFAVYDTSNGDSRIFRIRLDVHQMIDAYAAHIHESVRSMLVRKVQHPFGILIE